jgi:hypothetical protein
MYKTCGGEVSAVPDPLEIAGDVTEEPPDDDAGGELGAGPPVEVLPPPP